ncbi:MAG: hypothetical protein ACREAC_05905, partial [Blastocatellia bacterium]
MPWSALSDLHDRFDRLAQASEESLLTVVVSGRGLGFSQVRGLLRVKGLRFSRWIQAVFDGAMRPMKLQSLNSAFRT